MTLVEVIKAIEYVAIRQPSINMIVRNDVFRINEKPDARYAIFAWTQGQHNTSVDSDYINYTFTFFYVDRLKNDRTNQIEVQSVGVQTLDNIIRALDEAGVYSELNYTFQVFNQRFLDECAGVFCNVTLSVPIASLCAEDLGYVNDDIIIY